MNAAANEPNDYARRQRRNDYNIIIAVWSGTGADTDPGGRSSSRLHYCGFGLSDSVAGHDGFVGLAMFCLAILKIDTTLKNFALIISTHHELH